MYFKLINILIFFEANNIKLKNHQYLLYNQKGLIKAKKWTN